MSWGLGVCQLEIRRPRMGDAGVYMCIAENSEGSASVECNVMVKEPKERENKYGHLVLHLGQIQPTSVQCIPFWPVPLLS